jgi:AcrR family transcriptional regulator
MGDVAKAAGVSRQTIYRLFATRGDLLECIADQRIQVMGEILRPYFARVTDLGEALIEGSILSVQVGQSDPLFAEIIQSSGEHRLEQFLFKGSPAIQKLMLALWGPVLDRAREEGRLRPGITNEQAVEWIENLHAVLTIRGDYSQDEQRRILSQFLVPSMLRDGVGELAMPTDRSRAMGRLRGR